MNLVGVILSVQYSQVLVMLTAKMNSVQDPVNLTAKGAI